MPKISLSELEELINEDDPIVIKRQLTKQKKELKRQKTPGDDYVEIERTK